MSEGIVLQPLTPAYFPELFQLVSAMHEETGDMTLEHEKDFDDFCRFYAGFLASGGMGLLAMDGENPVGVISFNVLGRPYKLPSYGYTLHFYVEPAFRSKFVGSLLSRTAERMVRKTGIRDFEFLCTPKQKIVDKWKRRGWKVSYVVMSKTVEGE